MVLKHTVTIIAHREEDYRHPLKKGPKSMRRRNVSQDSTPTDNTPPATGTPSTDLVPSDSNFTTRLVTFVTL